MLDFIHQYAIGFVALPIANTAKQFHLGDNKNLNEGVVRILLDRLELLDVDANASSIRFPFDIKLIYNFNFKEALYDDACAARYQQWINDIANFNFVDETWRIYCIGALSILVFNALDLLSISKQSLLGQWKHFCPLAQATLLQHLYLAEMIISPKQFDLTEKGEFIIDKVAHFGVVASYLPLLRRLDEMLTVPIQEVLARINAEEQHVDRHLNVAASSLWHKKYFSELEKIVSIIFDTDDIENQPRYIADCGCGDGTLLKRLYQTIQTQTKRGKFLQQYPLTLLALDFNEVALNDAKKNLAGFPFICLKADISEPLALLDQFKQASIEENEVLHIRSFIDHERTIAANHADINTGGMISTQDDLLSLNNQGRSIPSAEIFSSLVAHLRAWHGVINRHGLVLLEVHAVDRANTKTFLQQSESFYFDFTQALSQQYLVHADQFHLAAAVAGFFIHRGDLITYPKTFPFKRITLCHFYPHDFQIRLASVEDLATLFLLEKMCWPESLQLSLDRLHLRIQQYPQGQYVLVRKQQILGCLYTQRINHLNQLSSTPFNQIESLHRSNGSYLQLLSINIHPDAQQEGLGDKLRHFVLQRARLLSGIISVVGVTRCSNRDPELSYQQAILIDPTVRFHQLGGAKILELIENYRVEDSVNEGRGILIEYELTERLLHPDEMHKNKLSHEQKTIHFHEMVRQHFIKKSLNYSPNLPLRDCGFDSLDLMELRYDIERHFNCQLDASFLFKYPTAAAMLQRLLFVENAKDHHQDFSEEIFNAKDEFYSDPVAFLGASCEFPEVASLDDFWRILIHNQSMTADDPSTRWQDDNSNTIKSQIKKAGLLTHYARFDAAFFRISPREASLMDPQQRLLLMHTWHALEHAGINPETLRGKRVGVFIGCCTNDFARLKGAYLKEDAGYYATGSANSILAGRLAYFFDWHGPAMVIDTACSSSMVALSLAKQAIDLKQCELAIVAGVNLILDPTLSICYEEAGMLSATDKCHSFDQAADGYVRSEGVVVCVLATHRYAQENNYQRLGTLEAVSVNQDGLSNGMTAPNPTAQQALIEDALKQANIDAAKIDFVEAHGTGTKLGDPVEIAAISSVMRKVKRAYPCLVSSVKSNIGHTEGSAGLASVLKVLLSLKHQQIPGTANFKKLNPDIKIDLDFLKITSESTPWLKRTGPKHYNEMQGKNLLGSEVYKEVHAHPQIKLRVNEHRFAGVSSFGFSGTNAHAIISDRGDTQLVDVTRYPFANHNYPIVSRRVEKIDENLFDLELFEPENVSEKPWQGQSEDELAERIKEIVAKVLMLGDSSVIQHTNPLKDYGLESLSIADIQDHLEKKTGLELPATLLFDYPTIEKLVPFIKKKLAGKQDDKNTVINNQLNINSDIAIIGYACRFPGNANTPEAFWQLLKQGKSGIVEMQQQRWNMSAYFDADSDSPGKMNSRHFGLIDGIDLFDAEFFNITPTEAIHLDPQQRLLLELTWETFESAAIKPSQIRGSNTGVFVGIMNHDYVYLNQDAVVGDKAKHSAYFASGEAFSMTAGRVAYYFDLSGPTMAIDTACSSSLVALHLACQSIKTGESAQALVAGVNLILSPEAAIQSAHANMLSPSGKCHTFDEKADGYVRGEGAGVILIKAYEQAIADKDPIFGIIKATAINHDGRSQGLTAPNGVAQQKLLRQTLQLAKLSVENINYIEAHGTGTPLGDPIEFSALQAVYAANRQDSQPLYVGSVKTNIGHAESASGIAGLIKILLMLEHKHIPAHLNLNRLNQNIQLASGVHINQVDIPWMTNDNHRRCAALSSFGFSGTNAHAIIEEMQVELPQQTSQVSKPLLFVFSAKHKESLKLLLQKYLDFFTKHQQYALQDVSYTLLTAREHFQYRCAFWAESYEALCYHLQDRIDKDSIEEAATDPWQKRYLAGEDIDGQTLFSSDECHRVSLPTIVFMRKSYWVNDRKPEKNNLDINIITLLKNNKPQFQQRLMKDYIYQQLVTVTGLEQEMMDEQLGFSEMGFDSLMAIEMQRTLQRELGLALAPTVLFDHPTIVKLSDYLLKQLHLCDEINIVSDEEAIQTLAELLEE